MDLKKVQTELISILESEVDVSPNFINPVGETKQDKFKLAILTGDNNNDNKMTINFIVGISVDTYDELLQEISKTIKKFKRSRLSVSAKNDYIKISSDRAFQIFTPESGKWIANLNMSVDVLYDFSETNTDYIFGGTQKIETVNYDYQ